MGMKTISWEDFDKVELRVGTIVDVQDFPEARKPSYIVWVDFGADIGMRKSSAQITHLYSKESLKGKQIVGVVNFPAKQIGPIRSEFLLTGFVLDTGEVVLAVPDKNVANGLRLA
jgi:tRNA-binding protein